MPPDFRSLLSKPAEAFKKPVPLAAGTYHGMTGKYTLDESKEKKTPFVRYEIKLTGPGEDVAPELLIDQDNKPIDLSKKSFRRDFYLTDDATYRLIEFAKSCGVPTQGRSLQEIIPDLQNQSVMVSLTQRANQDGTELYNDVKDIRGPESVQ